MHGEADVSRVRRVAGVLMVIIACFVGQGPAKAGIMELAPFARADQAMDRLSVVPGASLRAADAVWPAAPALALGRLGESRIDPAATTDAIDALIVRIGRSAPAGTDRRQDTGGTDRPQDTGGATSSVFGQPPRETLETAVRAVDLPPNTLFNSFRLVGQTGAHARMGGIALPLGPGELPPGTQPPAVRPGHARRIVDAGASTVGLGPSSLAGLVPMPGARTAQGPETFRTTLRMDPSAGGPGTLTLDLDPLETRAELVETGPLLMFGTQNFRREPEWDPRRMLMDLHVPETPILIVLASVLGGCGLVLWFGLLRTRAQS